MVNATNNKISHEDSPITAQEEEKTSKIIGAAIEVHRTLGPGLLEKVYEEALCHEFKLRHIQYSSQVPVNLTYKGTKITGHRLDMIVMDTIVVELKAVNFLKEICRAQVISYLKATGLRRGLVLNFCEPTLRDGLMRITL